MTNNIATEATVTTEKKPKCCQECQYCAKDGVVIYCSISENVHPDAYIAWVIGVLPPDCPAWKG